MQENDFREYFQYGAGAHVMLTKNPTRQSVEIYKDDLTKIVDSSTEQKLQIESWKEINPSLNSTLEQSESSMFIIYFIIYIALALLLVNSSLMSVFERIPEFGVIKSLGMKAHQIRNMILTETIIMAFISLVCGNALGFVFLYLGGIYGIDLGGEGSSSTSFAGASLDLLITPLNTLSCYVTPSILLFLSIFLSSIYPAVYGSKVNPLNAMRDL
jgi:ABC-type antimicrobial peptide transport system permease subunit